MYVWYGVYVVCGMMYVWCVVCLCGMVYMWYDVCGMMYIYISYWVPGWYCVVCFMSVRVCCLCWCVQYIMYVWYVYMRVWLFNYNCTGKGVCE